MLPLSDPFIVAFKKELLRWNRQISLVSRKSTNEVLDNLLLQSLAGFDVVWGSVQSTLKGSEINPRANSVDSLVDNSVDNLVDKCVDNSFGGVVYFDLGSGGGLPGAVWSRLLGGLPFPCCSFLVEPREKRAWFLSRVAGIISESVGLLGGEINVFPKRWGDGGVVEFEKPSKPLILISLKALHLNDEAVLEGLRLFFQGEPVLGNVFIARYYPGGQEVDEELSQSLGFPCVGEGLGGGVGGVFKGVQVLAVPPGKFLPTSLVLSHYVF